MAVPAVRVVNSRYRLCTSLVPGPMIVVFGLGTRLHVHMRTTLENGILCNGQQPQSVVNLMAFIDQCEFEAMPIGRRAPRCDKDQFHAKMTVSTSKFFFSPPATTCHTHPWFHPNIYNHPKNAQRRFCVMKVYQLLFC